jgi:hypothetical protein
VQEITWAGIPARQPLGYQFWNIYQMMRKTILHGTRHVVTTLLLAAAFLSLAQPSDAVPFTRKQAEQRAATFFHKRMARKAAPVQLSLALEKPTDATSAGYYIYNKVVVGMPSSRPTTRRRPSSAFPTAVT